MNGFNQLSAEHEARFGADNSLEIFWIMEEFVEGVEVGDDEVIVTDLLEEDEENDDTDADFDEIEEDGRMTANEFNKRTGEIFQAMQNEQLRKEALEAGYEIWGLLGH